MIPVCLVTGFLGAGKTTFLKHVVATHSASKIVYIVNEFSPLDIDGALVHEGADNVISVPGGSIFCMCLVTQFMSQLNTIPVCFDKPDDPIQGVIIEASGIANPAITRRMFHETGMDETYDLATIISVVDPGTFPKLLQTLPNISAQVEAADIVLINKTDIFSPAEIAVTTQLVRDRNATAEIIETIRCKTDIDLFASHAPRSVNGEYAKCADPNYATFTVHFVVPIDIDRLRKALDEAEHILYRAKGFVPCADGRTVYLDVSSAGVTVAPARKPVAEFGLTIIAPAATAKKAAALASSISAGHFNI